jgi:hypothetical protein
MSWKGFATHRARAFGEVRELDTKKSSAKATRQLLISYRISERKEDKEAAL